MPIPGEAIASAAIPLLTARAQQVDPAGAGERASTTTTSAIERRAAAASTAIPSRVSAHGAPR